MKTRKNTIFLAACAVCMLLASCSSSDSDDKNYLEENFFTVQNASYVEGSMPVPTVNDAIGTVSVNRNMIAGGSSIITLTSPVQLSSLLVSIDDEKAGGYYELPLTAVSGLQAHTRPAMTTYTYVAYLQLSQGLDENFEIVVAARTLDGAITQWWSSNVRYVAAGTGDLQVSLTFNNEKDVDLYVVEPNGHVIFYGNREAYLYGMRYLNGENYDAASDTVVIGLDLDSNAGCSIDGVDNENVSITKEYLQKGKYQVWVNLYSNCDPSIETLWGITALFEGQPITVSYGSNPAAGKYEVNAPSNYMGSVIDSEAKLVMEFTINEGVTVQNNAQELPRRLTPSARLKLQEVKESGE